MGRYSNHKPAKSSRRRHGTEDLPWLQAPDRTPHLLVLDSMVYNAYAQSKQGPQQLVFTTPILDQTTEDRGLYQGAKDFIHVMGDDIDTYASNGALFMAHPLQARELEDSQDVALRIGEEEHPNPDRARNLAEWQAELFDYGIQAEQVHDDPLYGQLKGGIHRIVKSWKGRDFRRRPLWSTRRNADEPGHVDIGNVATALTLAHRNPKAVVQMRSIDQGVGWINLCLDQILDQTGVLRAVPQNYYFDRHTWIYAPENHVYELPHAA